MMMMMKGKISQWFLCAECNKYILVRSVITLKDVSYSISFKLLPNNKITINHLRTKTVFLQKSNMVSKKAYEECKSPGVKINAVKNSYNIGMQYCGISLLSCFLINVVVSLIYNNFNNIWSFIWLPFIGLMYIFLFGKMIPEEVKLTTDNTAYINLGSMFAELKNAVVRDATDEDVKKLPCCTCNLAGLSWSDSAEHAIVIEGMIDDWCRKKQFFYCVPKSEELSALKNGTAAVAGVEVTA